MGGRWVHRTLEVDPVSLMGLCSECGPVRFQRESKGRLGCSRAALTEHKRWLAETEPGRAYQRKRWRQKEALKRRRGKVRNYRRFRTDACAVCGFVPVHHEQLEVDHIDSNRRNNHPSNLWTLCANCHRIKTALDAGRIPVEGRIPDPIAKLIILMHRQRMSA